MKKLIILLLLLTGVYAVHRYVSKKSSFEVNGRVIVSQASGLDLYAGDTPPPRFACIEGTIENTADRGFKNVLIVYTIGLDTVSANVGDLRARESSEFKSNTCRVRASAPDFTLEEVRFEEQADRSY